MKRRYQTVGDKWKKTKAMRGNRKLFRLIPKTRLMNRRSLRTMLRKYRMVYIKPRDGSLGRGVMKVKRTGKVGARRYSYQSGQRVRAFTNYRGLYRSIKASTARESYLVQRGIRLLKYKGRPFDIRVMVQQNRKGIWKVTGTVGRQAHPLKIVTNGSQGGTIYSVNQLLKPHLSSRKRKRLIRWCNRIGWRSAKRLHRAYPGLKEIGADIALDRRIKPWILEVNTRPDPCPFTKLKDKRMIRRILRYGRAIGRKYDLRCMKARSAYRR